jgi:hypothetical protein
MNPHTPLPGAYSRRFAPVPQRTHFFVKQRILLQILFYLTQRDGDRPARDRRNGSLRANSDRISPRLFSGARGEPCVSSQ